MPRGAPLAMMLSAPDIPEFDIDSVRAAIAEEQDSHSPPTVAGHLLDGIGDSEAAKTDLLRDLSGGSRIPTLSDEFRQRIAS
jgi:hypothetical protein